MDGGIDKKFGFWLGNKKYPWDVVDADIGNAFIIVIDFLKAMRCKIDLSFNNLELGKGDQVPAAMQSHLEDNDAVCICQVLLSSKSVRDLDQNSFERESLGELLSKGSEGANVLPGTSSQGCARLFTVVDTLNASNEISSMVINMLICHLKSECLCSVTGWHVRPLC